MSQPVPKQPPQDIDGRDNLSANGTPDTAKITLTVEDGEDEQQREGDAEDDRDERDRHEIARLIVHDQFGGVDGNERLAEARDGQQVHLREGHVDGFRIEETCQIAQDAYQNTDGDIDKDTVLDVIVVRLFLVV